MKVLLTLQDVEPAVRLNALLESEGVETAVVSPLDDMRATIRREKRSDDSRRDVDETLEIHDFGGDLLHHLLMVRVERMLARLGCLPGPLSFSPGA